jgi:hypothetical protein
MTKHWTDELDIAVRNKDGSWTDLETGFDYNADGSIKRSRKPRPKPKQLPSPKLKLSADDKKAVTAFAKRIRSKDVSVMRDIADARMPVIVGIYARMTGEAHPLFANKAAAIEAVQKMAEA